MPVLRHVLAPALLLGIGLQGCGGGGDDNASVSPVQAPPMVGATQTYAVTDTDNSNNLIHWTLQAQVTSAATDGSYVETDLGLGPNVTVNGIAYGDLDEAFNFDANRNEKGYVTGSLTCTYDQPKPPLPTNLAVGVAWPVLTSHLVCSDGSAFNETRQDGIAVDVETITVPAGTYSAKKVQFTRVVQFLAMPLVRTETRTDWYDIATGKLLQANSSNSFTGTAIPRNYLASQVQQRVSPN